MEAIPLDKINYNKVSKYANVLIFKEFYPKTKNVSYYLNIDRSIVHKIMICWLEFKINVQSVACNGNCTVHVVYCDNKRVVMHLKIYRFIYKLS